MSQLTFNIADYRTLAETHIRTVRSMDNSAGFSVVSPLRSGFGSRLTYTEPGVVDIREVKDAQRLHRGTTPYGAYQRRGKVLRFRGEIVAPVMNIRSLSAETLGQNDIPDLPPAA